ncbi:head maturation protease, ClpP-related [Corynebacterium striatum]|nr:Clp protease ClpP [Corynebacterium striatum]HAT6493895.1 Clp protease ClpP [Corynebacterium striatum]HAT6496207.1 Clp protease ClpP [Corynebacterium striatum]HAT6620125.1 Clp protease ClpP [Corynebacterium striatum]HCG3138930.1 ATP-dependent Clp protease proteolytic subunit [Corynebacterium striatum]
MNEILIYGDIGFEVQAKDIVSQLNDADGPVTVRVDSFGGDVYAGISILNALRRYPDVVTVYVDGIAASAASFIAVGGADRLIMSPNSSLLIHGAWSQGMGNSEEMAQLASDLNQITDNLATIYAEKTGQEPTYWRELMKKDTTFTAEQAVEAGLADAVDELEKSARAEKRHAVMAAQRSRFASHAGGRGVPEIETRAAAPPPPVARSESGDKRTMPSDGQIGDKMSILNQLAQELGKKPEDVQRALSGFFNEEVTVTATVDLAYPEDSTVVPTGAVEVAPVGEVPAGVAFELTSTPDGWTGEVTEDTGVLKVTAPANVEPDTTVEFTVTANGGDAPVELTVPVTVKAAAEPEEGTPAESTPAPTVPADDTVTIDAETYAELKAAAQHGWKAMEQQKEADLVAEVDGWIQEGRISAARRTKAIAAMKRDPEAARDIYGSNPAGTIPRAEIGYGKDTEQEPLKNLSAKADKVGFLSRKNFH